MRSRKVSSIQPSMKVVRVVLLGQDGVGKSALAVRFLTRRFIGEYDRTLEATYRHYVELENETLCMDLLDTAGENSVQKLQHHLFQGDIFIILYSITDKPSFKEARTLGHFIINRKNVETPSFVTIVATKKDLEHFREVDETEGLNLAKELGCSFQETSVSERDGYEEVSKMMHRVLREYLRRLRGDKERRTSGSYLSKMKEGIMKKTGSIRRRSVAF